MKFCECGGMIIPGKDAKCRTCGKSSNSKENIKLGKESEKKDTIIIEDNRPDLPQTDKECEKCDNRKAYFWLIQTRSADEPPTQFFKCTKCKYTWREYK